MNMNLSLITREPNPLLTLRNPKKVSGPHPEVLRYQGNPFETVHCVPPFEKYNALVVAMAPAGSLANKNKHCKEEEENWK